MPLYRIKRRITKSLDWLRGWLIATIVLPIHKLCGIPIANLNAFERNVPFVERREYAQNKEDGIINAIFFMIGTTNKYFVEFGAEDGMQCNTRHLSKHKGWKGLLMDGNHKNNALNLRMEFITAENIEGLFQKYDVPRQFDLLSIDIDGNDYWVWKAVSEYKPRVVIIEYNACISYEPAVTIPYDKDFKWDKTDYYGASLAALVRLGIQKGYTLVCTDSYGVNAFFVRDDAIKGMKIHDPETLYHPACFKGKKGKTHPKDPKKRQWIHVS